MLILKAFTKRLGVRFGSIGGCAWFIFWINKWAEVQIVVMYSSELWLCVLQWFLYCQCGILLKTCVWYLK